MPAKKKLRTTAYSFKLKPTVYVWSEYRHEYLEWLDSKLRKANARLVKTKDGQLSIKAMHRAGLTAKKRIKKKPRTKWHIEWKEVHVGKRRK